MKGFTLVEMLVALFIFALIAATGITIMRFAVDNQALVRGRADRLGELQRTRAILKADLVQATARRTRDQSGRARREAFYGGDIPNQPLLRFTRAGWDNPDAAPRASLQYVEYRLQDGRLERLAGAALDGGALGAAQVLVAGVRAVDVRFLWRGQWIETLPGGPENPLPQAVRLDMDVDGIGAVSQLFAVTGAPP